MEFLFAFGIFCLAMVGLGLGQIFGRKSIKGSCHADGGACSCQGGDHREHDEPAGKFRPVDAGLKIR